MKQVNEALKDIGIPVYAGVWRATSPNQNPPVQYCVYSTTTTEASHHDDHVTQVAGMRIAVEVFITAHRSSPPQNIFTGSRYGYSRLSKAIRVAL